MHSKGNHRQNEKTTYRMRENICKWWDWQGINFQSLQTAHATQYFKKTQSKKKKKRKQAEELNRHFNKEDIQMVKSTCKDAQHCY